MKNQILTFGYAIALTIGALSFTSCGEEQNHNHTENSTYECPMDCEHGKTYDQMGTCPVCKMDLVEVEKDSE